MRIIHTFGIFNCCVEYIEIILGCIFDFRELNNTIRKSLFFCRRRQIPNIAKVLSPIHYLARKIKKITLCRRYSGSSVNNFLFDSEKILKSFVRNRSWVATFFNRDNSLSLILEVFVLFWRELEIK